MKEIDADEFWQIVNNMPQEMQLPMYMGERDGEPVIRDLAEMGSVAFCGQCGFAAFWQTSIWSLLASRDVSLNIFKPYAIAPFIQYLPTICNMTDMYSQEFEQIITAIYNERKKKVSKFPDKNFQFEPTLVLCYRYMFSRGYFDENNPDKNWQFPEWDYPIVTDAYQYRIYFIVVDVRNVEKSVVRKFNTIIQFKSDYDGDLYIDTDETRNLQRGELVVNSFGRIEPKLQATWLDSDNMKKALKPFIFDKISQRMEEWLP